MSAGAGMGFRRVSKYNSHEALKHLAITDSRQQAALHLGNWLPLCEV
jgi:hypothetical protein